MRKRAATESQRKLFRLLLRKSNKGPFIMDDEVFPDDGEEEMPATKMWAFDADAYYPVGETCIELPPDYYEPFITRTGGITLNRLHFQINDLVLFEDDVINDVVGEITRFWTSPEKFKRFSLPYRRGILLYGPPGTGKSCTVKLILKQVMDKGGIGMKFSSCRAFDMAMKALRQIQPSTPVVCIMEDLESILQNDDESDILNLLDGVSGYENIVYIATTNYPEELGERISNRPSRFDKRYNVGFLNDKSRKIYIEHLLRHASDEEKQIVNVERWVKDTKDFTPAHIKELFISVVLYSDNYETVVKALRDMGKVPKAVGWKKSTGFSIED